MPDFDELIRQRRETRAVEYKASQPFAVVADKIAKTAMAMSNLRDGGYIVVGMAQQANLFVPTGVSAEHAATYSDDTVLQFINRFAQPYVVATVDMHRCDGADFIVIAVQPFAASPTICGRDAAEFRQGAIYVRSGRKPETAEVRTAAEMSDIIELAAEKRLAEYLGLLGRVGIPVDRLRREAAGTIFDEELEGH